MATKNLGKVELGREIVRAFSVIPNDPAPIYLSSLSECLAAVGISATSGELAETLNDLLAEDKVKILRFNSGESNPEVVLQILS